ncbi:MAG TPA: PilN domain-containing protein [Anaerolineae bacterium]|nr:PilN domain-containing protein [Anaerolineae bacterium]HOQ98891.1 PilN domain-containing protein [Anaerolineae bacterium]HPL29970.1 PilN domain-containing protein [Anaerolineae bacterium]
MTEGTQHTPSRHFLAALLPQGAAVLWLAAAALLLLSLPLFALFDGMRADVTRLRVAIVQAQAESVSSATAEELAALRQAAASGLAAEEQVSAAIAAAGLGVPWNAVLERALPVPADGISLTALEQRGAELRIQGLAGSEAALATYLARLGAAPVFDSAQAERGVASQPGGPGPSIAFAITLRVRGYQP